MPKILTTPQYRKLTAVASAPANVYDLDLQTDNSGVSAMNVSPILFDFITTLGVITMNLPAISDFLVGRSSGIGFQINGTIVAGVNAVTFVANPDLANLDEICGDPSKSITGVGTAFKIWISGTHEWALAFCIQSRD